MNSNFSLFVSNQQQQWPCLILQSKEPKLAESKLEMTKSMKNLFEPKLARSKLEMIKSIIYIYTHTSWV